MRKDNTAPLQKIHMYCEGNIQTNMHASLDVQGYRSYEATIPANKKICNKQMLMESDSLFPFSIKVSQDQ